MTSICLSHWSTYDEQRVLLALDLLGQAVERDPHYGPALALAAHCHLLLAVSGSTDDPDTERRTSVDLARRALLIGPDDPDVLAPAAFVLGCFGENIDVALGLIDHCCFLNPSCARGWFSSGVLRIFAGQPPVALEHFERLLRLSPRDRLTDYLTGIGEALFFSRRFDEAAAKLLASLERAPRFPVTYRVLAACYAHMGKLEEAREIVERLRAITPLVVPSATYYRKPEDRDLFVSGLRLAAGEAGS